MPPATILLSVGILLFSFLTGLITYYIFSVDLKEQKKKLIEDVTSLTINYIIYIWIGKIAINFTKFIKDPLSILAYPSNSYAIYVATGLMLINLLYRKYRHKERISEIIASFIPIFFFASFTYEFLQVIVQQQMYNIFYLLFITLLTIGYIIVYGKVKIETQSYIFGNVLLIGQLLLTTIKSITIFSYRLSPFYFALLIVIVLVTMIINRSRRKV